MATATDASVKIISIESGILKPCMETIDNYLKSINKNKSIPVRFLGFEREGDDDQGTVAVLATYLKVLRSGKKPKPTNAFTFGVKGGNELPPEVSEASAFLEHCNQGDSKEGIYLWPQPFEIQTKRGSILVWILYLVNEKQDEGRRVPFPKQLDEVLAAICPDSLALAWFHGQMQMKFTHRAYYICDEDSDYEEDDSDNKVPELTGHYKYLDRYGFEEYFKMQPNSVSSEIRKQIVKILEPSDERFDGEALKFGDIMDFIITITNRVKDHVFSGMFGEVNRET